MEESALDRYLKEVLSHVRFKDVHAEIRRELTTHAEELREHLRSLESPEPLGGDDAGRIDAMIVRKLGAAETLGRQFDLAHRPRFDWTLAVLVGLLLSVGLSAMGKFGLLGRQGLWSLLGLGTLVGLFFVRPAALRRASLGIYVVTFLLCALSLFGGASVSAFHAGQPYLSVGGLQIKIVDLSVILFAFALAGLLQAQATKTRIAQAGLLIASLAPLGGYLFAGSVYPGVLYFCVTLALMLVAGCTGSFVRTYGIMGGLLLASTVQSRSFVSAVDLSRVAGAERHTDFIFASVRDSSLVFGVLAMTAGVGLVIHLASRVRELRSPYLRTLLAGTAALFGVEVLWSLLSNSGIGPVPVTGVNFPFLSYGGSLMVVHLGLIGIALGAYRRRTLAS